MTAGSSLKVFDTTRDSYAGTSVNRYEVLALGMMLVLFLAVCACIRSRYIPWGDEVQFVDPAANLYFKLGFVSTEWSNQTDGTFWSGNAPAYPVLLYLGFRLFHFSHTVARSINCLLMAVAALSLWGAVRRARFLSQPNTRLLLLALVLTGYSCYSCYSNIRYDCLCLLECSLAFLAYTVTRPVIRNSCLFVLGVAMVLTNLQLPQYAVVLVIILAYAFSLGFTLIWKLRFLWFGFVAGGASLVLLYASHPGSLNAFFVTLRQQAGQPLWDKLHDLHHYFEYDPSLAALLLFLLASLAILRLHPDSSVRKPVIAGLLICTVIPVLFFLARRFVFSSAWMVYVPAAVCVCQVLEAKIHTSRTWQAFAVICCAAAIGFGLPKAVLGIWNDWTVRNYAVVDSFIAASVGAKDTAFCDPAAYFAAKPRVARIYGPGYPLSADEKKEITLVVVAPENEGKVTRDLGGKWMTVQRLVQDSRSNTKKLLPFSTNFACRLNVLRKS